MFEQKLKIEMGQVDGAGVIYAPRLMEISHSVYEAFLAQHGWSARRILDEEWALPIVHMESDFHLPIEFWVTRLRSPSLLSAWGRAALPWVTAS